MRRLLLLLAVLTAVAWVCQGQSPAPTTLFTRTTEPSSTQSPSPSPPPQPDRLPKPLDTCPTGTTCDPPTAKPDEKEVATAINSVSKNADAAINLTFGTDSSRVFIRWPYWRWCHWWWNYRYSCVCDQLCKKLGYDHGFCGPHYRYTSEFGSWYRSYPWKKYGHCHCHHLCCPRWTYYNYFKDNGPKVVG